MKQKELIYLGAGLLAGIVITKMATKKKKSEKKSNLSGLNRSFDLDVNRLHDNTRLARGGKNYCHCTNGMQFGTYQNCEDACKSQESDLRETL